VKRETSCNAATGRLVEKKWPRNFSSLSD